MRIWVDNREDNAFIRKGKREFPEMKVTQLPVGDAIIELNGKYLCVEHKRGDDFRNSINDKRLVAQPINMLQKFDYNFVMIEGTYRDIMQEYDFYNFAESQYNGKIASLAMKYVTPPITVDSGGQFWRMMKSFGERLEVAGQPLVKPIILPNKQDTLEVRMLMCIPGMGKEKASAILNKFDFWSLPDVQVEELMEVKGIGQSYANKIKENCKNRWF